MAILRRLVIVLAVCPLGMGSPAPSAAPEPSQETDELTSLPALCDGVVAEVLVEVGSRVKKGELLARLDPRIAEMERDLEIAKLEVARADLESAAKNCAEAERRYDTALQLRAHGCLHREDFCDAEQTCLRYQAELASQQQHVKLAELEYQRSRLVLGLCEVRAPADVVVRKLLKRKGETVKALETVILLEAAAD